MRFSDAILEVRTTVARHPMRTLLTLSGIMIGSGSIVFLAGMLKGGEQALVALSQTASESGLLRVEREEPPSKQLGRTTRELSVRDADGLQQSVLLNEANVLPEPGMETHAYWQGRQKRITLVGSRPDALSLYALKMKFGRFLAESDRVARRRVVVVGFEVWEELLGSAPNIDDLRVTILGESFSVVGVLSHKASGSKGDGTRRWDRQVAIPDTTFRAVLDPAGNARRLYVRTHVEPAALDGLNAIARVVEKTLLRRHLGIKNFVVRGHDAGKDQAATIVRVIELLLLGTGLVSLVVGGVNIMNIMLVSVAERTKEIGIRRAVGASRGAIRAQFLLESALISLLGGLIGAVLGLLFSWVAVLVLDMALGEWRFFVVDWAIVAGLVLAVATGLIFGWFPAWKASRLDPVEALRSDA